MDAAQLHKAADILLQSNRNVGFTGAGVSVESGIPPFRGENGLWNKYDPGILDLSYFYSNPYEAWTVIKEIFYDFFGSAPPNAAHTISTIYIRTQEAKRSTNFMEIHET